MRVETFYSTFVGIREANFLHIYDFKIHRHTYLLYVILIGLFTHTMYYLLELFFFSRYNKLISYQLLLRG